MAPYKIKTLHCDVDRVKFLEILAVILLMGIGGAMRFYNLSWDNGLFYHPDELNIGMAVERIRYFTQFDPGFFAYNGFSIYLIKTICAALTVWTSDFSWVRGCSNIILVGRYISAAASTLTIPAMFILGRSLIGGRGGLLAAAITTFTVGFIQYAHFAVTESMLTLFIVLLAILSARLTRKDDKLTWLAMAVIMGIAIGTKISALSFIAMPCALFGMRFLRPGEDRKKLIANALFAMIITVAIAIMVSPYSVINHRKFQESMKYEGGVVSGAVKVPYNLQFKDTTPYIFFLQNIPWQTGPIIPAIGISGIFIWLILMAVRREKYAALPFLIFGVAYFLYVGIWHTKFIRYMIPIYPVLIIAASWLMIKAVRAVKKAAMDKEFIGIAAYAAIVFTLAISIIWSAAFMRIYTRPSTRTAASEWMFSNIPSGSLLLTEHWDYGLPSHLAGSDTGMFRYKTMENYEPDSSVKITKMASQLSEGDYVVLSSSRLYGSIPKDPVKYPITSKYYDKLFNGRLGYKEIARFTSYPGLFGFEINNDSAEETFQVYDHPVVRIFVNEKRLDPVEMEAALREESM